MLYDPRGRNGIWKLRQRKESTGRREPLNSLPVLRLLAGSAGGAIVPSPARSEAECRQAGTKIQKSRRDD